MDCFPEFTEVCCVKGCDGKTKHLGLCAKHYARMKSYGSPVALSNSRRKYRSLPPEQRFLAKIKKTESCWFWDAGTEKDGYGIFSQELYGQKHQRAHRYSWAYHNKQKIPENTFVCHSCDNPRCVNPDHLFLGSHDENMNDMAKKERGAKNVLNSTQVRAIASDKRTNKEIAESYSVSVSAIAGIKSGRNWKHLPLKVHKNKPAPRSGSEHFHAKITEADVKAIRCSDESNASLASRYKMSPQSICDIRKCRTWKHVK